MMEIVMHVELLDIGNIVYVNELEGYSLQKHKNKAKTIFY